MFQVAKHAAKLCGGLAVSDAAISDTHCRMGEACSTHNNVVKGPGGFHKEYKLGKTIGKGTFALVKVGTHLRTKEKVAVKIMKLPPPRGCNNGAGAPDQESNLTRADFMYEIGLLCKLSHPNVVDIKEYFTEGDKVYIVMELLRGGEVLDSLVARGTYTEHDARKVFEQLIRGISYIHSKKVVHRDLKLENLLLGERDNLDTVKIVDFGLAKDLARDQMKTVCGSPQYVAPEVLSRGRVKKGKTYGPQVDLWSAGVILYAMLSGCPPFYDVHEPTMFNKIEAGEFDFKDEVWSDVSTQAKDLVRGLLTVDPAKRFTCADCLAHPWVEMDKVKKLPALTRTLSAMRTSSLERKKV